MVRIAVSVEGVTEERFIKTVLAPYLQSENIYLFPVNIRGNVNLDRVRNEVEKLICHFDYVTTLYDFYGFQKKTDGETKASLEHRIQQSIEGVNHGKLIPYIQMYEFEALLFSSPQAIGAVMQDEAIGDWAMKILNEFSGNPETINDSVQTAPSKRFEADTNYKKTIHGPNIAQEIGVEKIRELCAGFSGWVSELESLGQ
ncbi:MAG: DUF4276 family protein [Gammaproteobacteria bacterium]|nr:DUF4276 family protein [Gammaproteobacteria bacterium]